MEVVGALLLLVAAVWSCAVEAMVSPGLQRDVTSLLDGYNADAQFKESQQPPRLRVARDFLSLAVEHGPVSVVQDWSLVCVQLCGAALGGGQCAPYCESVTVPESVQKSNAEILLSPNQGVICKDLCTLKLGGSICTCSSVASALSIQDRNRVCQTFCVNNMETLAGCSTCDLVQLRKLRATIDDDATEEEDSSEKVSVAPAAANSATTPSTTPDWDALCVTLCKTGDGGSLCNCDLSPFF